jgi:putative hydrolase of the HAD superfamily
MDTVVVFDLFGVIARVQSAEGKDRVARTAGLPSALLWPAYWDLRPGYDRGDMAGPEYWRAVAAAVGTTFDDHRIGELIVADVASWDAIDDDMVALVGQLAADGHRIGLLSNIPAELAAHYEERHPWLRVFEVLGFSCRIGYAKPELGAFRWSADALATEPDRILFVDDRPDNVQAAEATGMNGHVFTDRASLLARLSQLSS